MPKRELTFRYRIRNWPEYNRALVKRGELTLWFDEEAVAGWRDGGPDDGPGSPKVYGDAAIQCALVLKSVFHLGLRSTQGFLRSLVELLALDLPVPDYSTVSRRQGAFAVRLPDARCSRRADPPPWRVARDASLRTIEEHGRYAWRVSSGCTRQSLAANAVSRFKAVFGPTLSARRFDNQQVEATIKCSILNRMVALGLPRTESVF